MAEIFCRGRAHNGANPVFNAGQPIRRAHFGGGYFMNIATSRAARQINNRGVRLSNFCRWPQRSTHFATTFLARNTKVHSIISVRRRSIQRYAPNKGSDYSSLAFPAQGVAMVRIEKSLSGKFATLKIATAGSAGVMSIRYLRMQKTIRYRPGFEPKDYDSGCGSRRSSGMRASTNEAIRQGGVRART